MRALLRFLEGLPSVITTVVEGREARLHLAPAERAARKGLARKEEKVGDVESRLERLQNFLPHPPHHGFGKVRQVGQLPCHTTTPLGVWGWGVADGNHESEVWQIGGSAG